MIRREDFQAYVHTIHDDRRRAINGRIQEAITRAIIERATEIEKADWYRRNKDVDVPDTISVPILFAEVEAKNIGELETFKAQTIEFVEKHGWKCRWKELCSNNGPNKMHECRMVYIDK